MAKEYINEVLSFLEQNPRASSKEVHDGLIVPISYATIKRLLSRLAGENLLSVEGRGKGTKYSLSSFYQLLAPVNVDEYFTTEIDDRKILENYNFRLIPEVLSKAKVFSEEERRHLDELQNSYTRNTKQLSESAYRKDFEKLAIDLSWKSSQIEGNTYTLLETERLIRENKTASGKSKEDATMLLNHKTAIDFIVTNSDYIEPLATSTIEDIHKILTSGLNIDMNIRKRKVGISGTNYKPLDNEFQIREALKSACDLINLRLDAFEKALMALALLSYIQPFTDGNKRTARIVCNAILINHKHCPLSFRTVDSATYKEAMLLFYEQNNITAIKNIFIEQFEFAVNTYF